MPPGPVISAAEAPTFELPGIQFTGLAAPSRGAAESCAWIVAIESGTPGTPHQLTREEIIIAIEGKAKASVGGVEYDLEAGGAVIVPARTDFSLHNPYDSRFRAVAVLPVGATAMMGNDAFVPPWAL
jgi:mannose-6-phosphate isomerase-like protein (cupin superfamily)